MGQRGQPRSYLEDKTSRPADEAVDDGSGNGSVIVVMIADFLLRVHLAGRSLLPAPPYSSLLARSSPTPQRSSPFPRNAWLGRDLEERERVGETGFRRSRKDKNWRGLRGVLLGGVSGRICHAVYVALGRENLDRRHLEIGPMERSRRGRLEGAPTGCGRGREDPRQPPRNGY